MIAHSASHLADSVLVSRIRELVGRGNGITAELLVCLAEADERKLYLPAGYSSLSGYCIAELGLSEDATHRRINAARVARRFPLVFDAVADGRLHLTAIGMLSVHLTPENADELLRAGMGKSRAGIQKLLAERFPQPDLPTWIRVMPQPGEPAPARVEEKPGTVATPSEVPVAPSFPTSPAPARVAAPVKFPRVTPLAPERYALQLTMSQAMHDRLRQAQALLSHQVPSGDVVQVLDRALTALIAQLEKHKYGVTAKPRPARRPKPGSRHVPAEVRRRVRERDGDQCTFVGDSGHRCQERRFLEFDHVLPVARGGAATAANLRLRCRAHNQHAAERAFGAGFMRRQRGEPIAADDARPR